MFFWSGYNTLHPNICSNSVTFQSSFSISLPTAGTEIHFHYGKSHEYEADSCDSELHFLLDNDINYIFTQVDTFCNEM